MSGIQITTTSLTKLKPYTELRDAHKGESAFVLGAGPSLLGWLSHPRRDEIHKSVVVSVNSSIIALDWSGGEPDRRYWISNDALCRRWSYWDRVKRASARKVVRDSWQRYYSEIPEFYCFWPRPTSEDEIRPEDTGLAYCSSVPTAIDLCLYMGCTQVFLLGVDQYNLSGKSHFWQFLPQEEQPVPYMMRLASEDQQKAAFNYNDLAYPALLNYGSLRGAKIYNCNPLSEVQTFERILFDQALERTSDQWPSS